jgi:D-aminoacyl-tRNA deacylase
LLPTAIRESRPTLVFPSIHRSRENVVCLTVHPLGNLGPAADVGGRPRTVNPTDPRAMATVLRRLSELSVPSGFEATYESTHHGPELGLPSFFAEIGFGSASEPPAEMVKVLASALRELDRDSNDRVALAVGGGHYAPHFTEIAVRRRWAFGHIISRHSLAVLDEATAAAAYAATPEAEGIVYARAADSNHPMLAHLGPRRRDVDAETRGTDASIGRPIGDAPASGT